MNRRIRILVLATFYAGTAVACASNSSPPSATAATVTNSPGYDESSAGLLEHHRFHHHGGVTLFIAMSADTLGLAPDKQAAVQKIRADLHARMEPGRAAEQQLVATLADGLATGRVDTSKVDAAIGQVAAAAATVHDASADALNQLHALLVPAERAALVDKVEAHWAVWQRANTEQAETGTASKGPDADDHLGTVVRELGLTHDEEEAVRKNLSEERKSTPPFQPQQVAGHIRAFGDAFRSETFDARQGPLANGKEADVGITTWGATHLAHFIEAVTPVLTQVQREKFADHLREHATHDPSTEESP